MILELGHPAFFITSLKMAFQLLSVLKPYHYTSANTSAPFNTSTDQLSLSTCT